MLAVQVTSWVATLELMCEKDMGVEQVALFEWSWLEHQHELLYQKDLKPPQVPVQNAAQLEELLREDPAWFLQVSRGMSVARHEGSKMDEDRLMSLFADPAEGQRVAQVLRSCNAKKHWSLGKVEEVLGQKGDAFGELHRLMQAEALTLTLTLILTLNLTLTLTPTLTLTLTG